MKALLFEINFPFFSVKVPYAYQMRVSNILVPPSTLFSAIYRSYVEVCGWDYSLETLQLFTENIQYVGVAVLPREKNREEIGIKVSSLLLRHFRTAEQQKRAEGKEGDAMLREIVFLDGRLIGLVLYDELKNMTEAVEAITWLGNTESLVSTRVLEELPVESRETSIEGEAVMTQIVADDRSKLPQFGVVEIAGKIAPPRGEGRKPQDVCYVWHPVASLEPDVFRPIRVRDIRSYVESHGAVLVKSTVLECSFAAIVDEFNVIFSSSSHSRGRKKGKRGKHGGVN